MSMRECMQKFKQLNDLVPGTFRIGNGTSLAPSSSKTIPWRYMMDALELLKQDHEKVSQLLERGQEAEPKQRKQIFKEIKTELDTHARIEETIFYPALQEHEELKDMVLESLEEHKQMKTVLRELAKLSPNSERFKPKLKVLKDNVKHHAVEEEEGKMFPKIRKIIDKSELEQLGEELEAAKSKRLRKAS
jgi:iron-sulfur cluster repair protein YtfE (RIC family)